MHGTLTKLCARARAPMLLRAAALITLGSHGPAQESSRHCRRAAAARCHCRHRA
jgi:hypothetical protein